MLTPHQFDVHLHAIPASDRIAAIAARDAAIRADQARRDAKIARSRDSIAHNGTGEVIAAEIERHAGIGEEKGDD